MADMVTLNARYQMKRDTLAKWQAVETTFKPMAGEIIVYEIPTGDTSIANAPATLIKIGDGTNYLKDLKYLAARAADVASFLKTDSTGATWTQAKFEAWIKSLVTIDDVDTSAFAKDADLQQAIKDLTDEIARAKEAEAKALTDAKDYTDQKNTAMDGRMQAVEGKAHEHANAEELAKIAAGDKAKWDAMEQNAKDYADDLDEAMGGRVKAMEDKVAGWDAAEQNAKGYADGLNNAMGIRVGAVENRATAVEGDIETLKGNASTEGSVDYKIAQAMSQLMENPDDAMNSIQELVDWANDHAEDALALSNQVTQNKNDIAAEKQRAEGVEGGLETRLAAVEGMLGAEGDVAGDIADALADAKKYTDDEVKELADGAVAANAGEIADLKELVGTEAVGVQIDNKIAALKNGQLTTMQGEIDDVEGRVEALEAIDHEHANKDVLDGVSAERVAAWDGKVDSFAAGTGLKAERTGNAVTLNLDPNVIFVFNGGTSTTVLE